MLHTRKKTILKALKLTVKDVEFYKLYTTNYRYCIAKQVHDLLVHFNIKGHIRVGQMIVHNQLNDYEKQKLNKRVRKLKLKFKSV